MRLEATDITAGYGATPVLKEATVRVESGEFVGLIGPNGCGKSTLLRVLTRTLRPASGTVLLDGREIRDWSPREIAQRIAVMPQQEQAAFDFTVRDLVLMGRHPHIDRRRGETEQDYQLVLQSLADADLLHLADRPVTELSGGEYRRVLLARALAQQTPLMLLDEPTAHLDITHQVELLSLVQRQTRDRAIGALAALHDLNQAGEFCDRLILLCAGRIVADGTPEHVLTPEHLRRAYAAEIQIGTNMATGRPMLLSLQPGREAVSGQPARHVHLICGGGTGMGMLGALVRAGFRVSAGVLSRMDSDQAAGEALGIEMALEAPFAPIGPESRAACAELMARAETILIAALPVGHGNLANFELAVEAQSRGTPVVLLGDPNKAEWDYTGGKATALRDQLLQNGARSFDRLEDWLTAPTG